MTTAKQRAEKAARRAAHAARSDARRPKGSELLSDQRKRAKQARLKERRDG